ncbi:MAG: carboxymuconolactone decarboxylase family protein [Deltaproteobacteria bacterium]|jgi:4-carboxymuconolactone decarboxylase|nr:carboxymuconolactone decarboxylase family protein [Deltaproteobacteria bacterium]
MGPQKLARISFDVPFGKVQPQEAQFSTGARSLITAPALMMSAIVDSSLSLHLSKMKENGATEEEIAQALTHLFFTADGPRHGRLSEWPMKSWQALRRVKTKPESEKQRQDDKIHCVQGVSYVVVPFP